jgi:hypothetical protein
LDIEVKKNSTITNQIVDSLTFTLPTFMYNPYKNQGSNVNTANNSTVTLTDSIYKDVKVGKNATVIFTSPVLYLKKLHSEDGATIKFTSCAVVKIDDHLHLDKDNNFNPDGNAIVVYSEKHVHIHEGSTVKGAIYALDHFDTKGKDDKRVTMIGQFIGKEFHSDYTTWNWGTACNTNCNFKATQILAANDESNFLKEGEVRLNIFPNPSTGKFTIDINSPLKGTMNVTIYNPLGQIVKTVQDTEFDGVGSIDIDLTKYASTYYLVKVDLPSGSTTRKVIMVK